MATATLSAVRTRRVQPTVRRSIREICLLHCNPRAEAPQAGDSVRVAGRVYQVISMEIEGPGYVHVYERPASTPSLT